MLQVEKIRRVLARISKQLMDQVSLLQLRVWPMLKALGDLLSLLVMLGQLLQMLKLQRNREIQMHRLAVMVKHRVVTLMRRQQQLSRRQLSVRRNQ